MDYSEKIEKMRSEWDMYGWTSQKSDARLMSKIINVLANEDGMTVSRAQDILTDTSRIVPELGTI